MAASSSASANPAFPPLGSMGDAIVALASPGRAIQPFGTPPPAASTAEAGGKRARTAQPTAKQQEYDVLIESLDAKLPPTVHAKLRKIVESYGTKVQKHIKSTKKLEQCKEQLECLLRHQWPNGIKPFTLNYDSDDLNTPFKETTGGDYNYIIKFPQNTSIRDAKKKMYEAFTVVNKQLDLQVMLQQTEQAKAGTDFDSFIKECVQCGSELEVDVQILGIDFPPGLFASKESITKATATTLYKKLMVSLALEQKKLETEQARKKKVEAGKVKTLTELAPKDLFERAVHQAMAKKHVNVDKQVDYTGKHLGEDPALLKAPPTEKKKEKKEKVRKHTKKELAAKKAAKNGSGPGELAQNNKPRTQPQPAGQQTSLPKGKAKGKGKEQNSAGKGKGKGKHSHPTPWHDGKGGKKGGKHGKSKGKGKEKGSWQWW